jgi:hypothetical protein
MSNNNIVPQRKAGTGTRIHEAAKRCEFIGTVSVRFDTGRRTLHIARGENYGGQPGSFRVRISRRWLVSTDDGQPLFFSRSRLLKLIAALVLGDDAALPSTSPDLRWFNPCNQCPDEAPLPVKRKYARQPQTRFRRQRVRVEEKEPATPAKPVETMFSGYGEKTKEAEPVRRKRHKSTYGLTSCPFTTGSMHLEGVRMPDPAWGF